MPWWVANILFPLAPAIIAIIVGCVWVTFPKATHGALGEGQLFFVAAALAGQSLGSGRVNDPITHGSLWGILLLSVALSAAGTGWKYSQPPRKSVATLFTIGGSIGMVLWVSSIALTLF